jgi:methionine synthase / methylenetetrahydrofolate reductase(NADPH)
MREANLASELTSRMKESVLVCDGAMGTMLYQKGIYINRCFDELNLSQPSLVEEVHRAYLAAGAQIIETNTFGANRSKLLPHGLESRIQEINAAGARIARKAVEQSAREAFVAGAVGPVGGLLHLTGSLTPDQMHALFLEQITGLLEGGVDCLLIETISHIEEMRQAIRAARSLSDRPIIAQMTFTEDGTTLFGDRPEEVVAILLAEGASVVGANCGIGPKPMLEVLERMAACGDNLLSAQPNAGSPQRVDGRYIYFCSPEYMASYARRFILSTGVRIVGGCCGTTPEHIRAVVSAVRSLQPQRASIAGIRPADRAAEVSPVPIGEKSAFAERLLTRRFVASVELDPPRGTDVRKVIAGARALKEAGVDAVNIPDGPRASARISSLSLGVLLAQGVGIEVLLHYCCRDRNLLGMQSDLLGAHALGLRNLILITGDPPKLGDYPNATAVFDVDSIGLTEIVRRLNHGRDMAGNPIGDPTSFLIGVGVNPAAHGIGEEIRRLRLKVAAGAEYALTQPVFDTSRLKDLLDQSEDVAIPILVGILPLTSYRNAEFYHNEVPGMSIPEEVRERMRVAGTGEVARREGVRIAREALETALQFPRVRGTYVMPPFGRYEMALEVLDGHIGGSSPRD